jgi:hypothetical protein
MPAIAWWPGVIRGGATTTALASTLDIYATFLELAGLSAASSSSSSSATPVDSHSLVPLLLEPAAAGGRRQHSHTSSRRDAVFLYNGCTLFAVRLASGWKAHYITQPPKGMVGAAVGSCDSTHSIEHGHHSPPILYHIPSDPGERFPVRLNTSTEPASLVADATGGLPWRATLSAAEVQQLLERFNRTVEAHLASMLGGGGVVAPSRTEPNDWSARLCCNASTLPHPCFCDLEPFRRGSRESREAPPIAPAAVAGPAVGGGGGGGSPATMARDDDREGAGSPASRAASSEQAAAIKSDDDGMMVAPAPRSAQIADTTAASAAAATAVLTHATQKILKHQAASHHSAPLQLAAAKNEYEPMLVVLEGAQTVSGVQCSLVVGKKALPTTVYRVGYISVVNITDCASTDGPGEYPDPLIPDVDNFVHEKRNAFPISVPAKESRQVLVDLFIPPDTPAGYYAGTVTVTIVSSGGGRPATTELPFYLTVHNFSLPSTASMGSEYGITSRTILAGHQLCRPGALCRANASEAAERFALFRRCVQTPEHIHDCATAATVPHLLALAVFCGALHSCLRELVGR